MLKKSMAQKGKNSNNKKTKWIQGAEHGDVTDEFSGWILHAWAINIPMESPKVTEKVNKIAFLKEIGYVFLWLASII
jgi:hypothetical protein